ncbi:ABC transporter ATP-binding protein [Gordonia hongkongensis]|uniref:ABC transporter ATP-binding protein n=1 Tax=Gordonia hongkongensis TaxID=1701090 RepID=A0AAX3T7H0_9ACTN|nr:ABC transporter ATP-binding protein [Gordonia hongkongensis]QIK45925.1 ABC transporter ATP-binding protein [Gordonia terrae]WFP25113.1 ABC transporter ATP-binding protein [Gordonia hongkongensis]
MTAREAYLRFLPALRGEGPRFTLAATLLLIATACEVIAIFVLSDVIDGALSADSALQFARLAALWLLITAISTAADYYGQVAAVGVSERVVLRLRNRLFAHVQRLSPVIHRRFGLGDMVTRHSSDLEAVEYLIGSGVMQLIVAVTNTIGLVVAALIMSWQVAVVAIAAVPALWAVSAFYGRRQTLVTRDERTANAGIAVAVQSALSGHETAVAYNQQNREQARLHHYGFTWLGARLSQTRIEAGFGAVMGFGQVVVTLAIAVAGVWQVRQSALSVGELIALTGYLGMLYPKMQELAEVRLSLASAAVSAERIGELLDLAPTDADCDDAITDLGPDHTVSMREVTLRRGETTVLDRVSLDLHPGTITALVGPSGAGKSTLASLLCRFDRPDAGTITLGEFDYAALSGRAIRDHVTLLPQQPIIKATTVADNIAYGRPDATRAEIISAAIAADADPFINELPDGYDTPLDEDGLTLSGGQRQRIAIARAILRDSPVLVLDEPTSGLDDETAQRILEPLRRLAHGRSTLLITHDPRVTEIADEVAELRDGVLTSRRRDHALVGSSDVLFATGQTS